MTDRELWHSILAKCHRNNERGIGVRLTADEVNLMANMFELGVDLLEGEDDFELGGRKTDG